MSGLLGSKKSQASTTTVASGLTLQSSVQGAAIPIIYGTTRVAQNLGWYGAFTPIFTSSGGGGGGKGGGGGGGGKGGNSGEGSYTYSTAFLGILSEGPINGVNNVYANKNIYTLAEEGLSLFTGAYGQAPWGYLTTNFPTQALGYSGFSYVCCADFSLGTSPQLPNFNYEIAGVYSNQIQQEVQGEQDTIPSDGVYQITVYYSASFTSDVGVTDAEGNVYTKVGSSPGSNQYSVSAGVYQFSVANEGTIVNISYNCSAGPDADPSLVVVDLLTNPHYGIGFPSARVGSFSIFQEYCIATGLLISPAYTAQQQASSYLTDIATATNSNWVWTNGALTLIPYGDQTITANGYTYTAPTSVLGSSLTDDDFMPNQNATGSSSSSNQDPVLLTRTRPADAYNSIKLEWLNRANQYNPAIVEAKDQTLINLYGLRQDASRQFHMFCNGNSALISVQLQLQRQYVRNLYQFQLDQRYLYLDPMDIIPITDSAMGLNAALVRIIEITENDDYTLSISAEQVLDGIGNTPGYTYQINNGFNANYNESPGDANVPVIFEPPIQAAFTGGLEVDIATSGGTLWGGCDIWISADNTTYAFAGSQNGGARQGVLTSILPIGVDPDLTDTLALDLTESRSQLLSGTQADADNFTTLCYVDGEMISYETATLTSAYKYGLTYLRRGVFGTPITSHAINSQFARMDNGIFPYAYDKSKIGTTIYIKILGFNIYDGGQQAITDVDPYTYVIQGPPLPGLIQNFTAQQNGGAVVFGWTDLTDGALMYYDILYGPQGGSVGTATLLTEATRATEMTNASVPPGSWTFYIRGHDIADQFGPASSVDLVVTNENDIISTVVQEVTWFGTLSNLVLHYTGILIPFSLYNASQWGPFSTQGLMAFTPTVSAVAGGSLTLGTLYVKLTYVDNYGESTPSNEASIVLLPTQLLQVTSPATPSPAAGYINAPLGYNVYVGSTSGSETLQNAVFIPFGINWTIPTTGLIAGTAMPTLDTSGWDVFDDFVPFPVSSGSYTAPTVDTGYNANLRVYSTSSDTLGPGQTGTDPALTFQIDTWLTGGSDPNVYDDWTIGYAVLRYLNARLLYSGITDGNVAYITDFTPIIDTAPVVQDGGNIVVAPGGTAITFGEEFHQPPNVVCTVISSTALYGTAVNVTQTGFTAHVWNNSGSDVGGTINWQATGD